MDRGRLERELRDHLKAKVKKVEPSSEWWNNTIYRLGEQDQISRTEKPSFWQLRPSMIAIPLSIILLIILVGSLIPMLGGMTPPPPASPAVVSDGNGGVFVFWDDTPYNYSTGLYVNHIDADGNYLWGIKGKEIAEGKVTPPQAISDGVGGTIVAWGDSHGLSVQRLNSNGSLLWKWENSNSGLSLRALTGDGAGGAILLWQDRAEQVYAQRINAEGTSLWGEIGTFVGKIQYAYLGISLVSDNSGGAMVAWLDPLRKGIYAQRFNKDGKLLWGEGGIAVTTLTNETERLQIINDGNGNIIVAWVSISWSSGFQKNIYLQQLDADGNRLWGEQGILLDGSKANQSDPQLTADGSGGCIIAWQETGPVNGSTSYILAQRINSTGKFQWQQGGVSVANPSQSLANPELGLVYITGNGDGGCTVIWVAGRYTGGGSHERQVYAQKLSPDGQKLWSESGLEVYQTPPFQAIGYSNVTSDGSGGFIISSRVSEGSSVSSTDSVYAQKISPEGSRLWNESGLAIQVKPSSPMLPIIAIGIILVTVLILIGVFRRSRHIRILTAIVPVVIGIAALFSTLLVTGLFMYTYQWAYVLRMPVNQAATAIVPIAGLTIVAVGIWKKTISKWIMVPVLIFCVITAIITVAASIF